jgi:hypothetical protein
MESGKIIFFLLLVFIAIMFGIGYDETSSKANFKQEKGSVVVLIKASKSNRSVTPYTVYLRDSLGSLREYKITIYERNLINLGDTIK